MFEICLGVVRSNSARSARVISGAVAGSGAGDSLRVEEPVVGGWAGPAGDLRSVSATCVYGFMRTSKGAIGRVIVVLTSAPARGRATPVSCRDFAAGVRPQGEGHQSDQTIDGCPFAGRRDGRHGDLALLVGRARHSVLLVQCGPWVRDLPTQRSPHA